MLSPSGRALFTLIMWFMLIGAMIVLTALLRTTLQEGVIAVTIIFAVVGVAVSGFIWNWGQIPNESHDAAAEVLKRNRLTMALRDLTDDELARLRQRLATGDIDDDQLSRLLDESEAGKLKRR